MNAPEITEEWLIEKGFKWSQLERQPNKHWCLWIASAITDPSGFGNSPDELGIELSKAMPVDGHRDVYWNCWIRNDVAGRYAKIIHVRLVHLQAEIESIIKALIGGDFSWSQVWYGSLRTAADSERLAKESQRLDRLINDSWVERVDAELGKEPLEKAKSGVQ